jgi:hypothetical protein
VATSHCASLGATLVFSDKSAIMGAHSISQLLMKPILFALVVVACFTIVLGPRRADAVQVTLILRNIETYDFVEWKVKSNEKWTRTTGRLGRDNAEYVNTWELGDPGSHIRFWWGRLNGAVDTTILVNNYVVFKGRCIHDGTGRVRVIDSCSYPLVYRTAEAGGGPYLLDKLECNVTYVHFNTTMLGNRFNIR